MNEHTARGRNQLTPVDQVTATDVQEGIHKALVTNSSNQYVMTFEGSDQQGRHTVSPYIKKAGRSVVLNEVAKRKGGLAKLQSICVRSAQEKRSELLDMLAALPSEMKTEFIQSRGGDYRCLSMPDGWAVYLFKILFRNGELWEGEGLASVRNVRSSQLHTRLDEMAETRAYMRCVGRGTADGFIRPDQACGADDWDATEAELLAEDEAIDVTEDTDASRFPSPDGDGAAGAAESQESPGVVEAGDSPAGAVPGGTADQPADGGVPGDTGDIQQDRGDQCGPPTAEQIQAMNEAWDVLETDQAKRDEFLARSRTWAVWEHAVMQLQARAEEGAHA